MFGVGLSFVDRRKHLTTWFGLVTVRLERQGGHQIDQLNDLKARSQHIKLN